MPSIGEFNQTFQTITDGKSSIRKGFPAVGKIAKGKADEDKAAQGKASMQKFLSSSALPKFAK